ncbi:cysteine--tRNA ligase [Rubrobacter tropicus]|uniref:Cysteine--tRNA ligase n=1 Tax=Rubrobacter tropicus TaxID=2653851 RepID=A0A6G8QB63_9ACTN|nr:cysteine--tRNA ligase [Rubrobacter tropicus]QIN83673.1 cysteine--tRNA ligase [Rubrobacter tropicus]
MSVFVRDSLSGGMVEVGRDGKVGLYVCGPTVYDHIHIGNARAPLFWDVVVRYLRSRDYDVTFVQNITDIEDKIIAKANAEGASWQEVVDRYTDSFHGRLEMLGIGLPDVEPRATQHIPEMISLIEELVEKGHAYAPGNGDVYYSVESFPGYGSLSHQNPREMRETEKGQTDDKRSPLDFALWKASKPGEPEWESPWGRGRPGWHIECSAMVEKHLPEGADIHGGGTDIRFPHHENELAQSAAAHPEHTFVRAWAHHGMVTFGGTDKMAKSVGNVLDVQRAVKLHGRNAVRMWLLQSHYSQPIEYSAEILEEKRRSYERLLRLYRQISDPDTSSELSDELAAGLRGRFDEAMRDDFNTPEVVATLFEAANRAAREISDRPESAGEFGSLAGAIEEVMTVFGFDLARELAVEVGGVRVRYTEEPGEEVLGLAANRELARRAKDWATADRLREELAEAGWAVEDTPDGPILSRR